MMLGGLLSAQISITSSDMPQPGDTITLSEADPGLVMNPGATGQNHTWDYTNLVADTTYLKTFGDPDDSPSFIFRLTFFNATMMDVGEANGLLLFTGMDREIFPFYEARSSSFEYMGYGAYIDSFPTPVTFTDPDVIYPLPMTFGTTNQSVGKYVLNLPNVMYYRQLIDRNTEVDGHGYLELPNGVYTVIRVHSEVVEQDSLYLDSLGFGFNLPANTRQEYKWLSNGYPTPLLEVHETRGFGGPGGQLAPSYVVYRESQGPAVGRAEPMEAARIKVYPNPAEGFVKVEVPGAGPMWVRVLDLMGREVSQHSLATRSMVLETGQLKSGVYTLEVINEAGRFSQKLVIK